MPLPPIAPRLSAAPVPAALLAPVALVALAALAALPGRAGATVLTFDQVRLSQGVVPTVSGNDPPADYGDRVFAGAMAVPGGTFTYGEAGEGFTPDVVVDVFSGGATTAGPAVSLWAGGYGDLANVLIGNNNSSHLDVRLLADPGFEALLYGFDLAGYPLADYTLSAVRVFSGTDLLLEVTDVLVEGNAAGPGHTAFTFASPLAGAELLLQVDYGNLPGGQHDNIGLDNLRFGQTPPAAVPLPGTAALILPAVAWVARYRRRAR